MFMVFGDLSLFLKSFGECFLSFSWFLDFTMNHNNAELGFQRERTELLSQKYVF